SALSTNYRVNADRCCTCGCGHAAAGRDEESAGRAWHYRHLLGSGISVADCRYSFSHALLLGSLILGIWWGFCMLPRLPAVMAIRTKSAASYISGCCG